MESMKRADDYACRRLATRNGSTPAAHSVRIRRIDGHALCSRSLWRRETHRHRSSQKSAHGCRVAATRGVVPVLCCLALFTAHTFCICIYLFHLIDPFVVFYATRPRPAVAVKGRVIFYSSFSLLHTSRVNERHSLR